MKKVLIAIDYNPISEKVAEAGKELAKQMNAEIGLVHVIADINYYGTTYPTFMGYNGYNTAVNLNVNNEMRKVAEDFLETAAKHLGEGQPLTTHLADGDTANELLRYSKEWSADLLVMGTHSHSTLEKIFMGSVASKVIEKTEIPVYLVPIKGE